MNNFTYWAIGPKRTYSRKRKPANIEENKKRFLAINFDRSEGQEKMRRGVRDPMLSEGSSARNEAEERPYSGSEPQESNDLIDLDNDEEMPELLPLIDDDPEYNTHEDRLHTQSQFDTRRDSVISSITLPPETIAEESAIDEPRDPKGYPDVNYDPDKPFNFLACDTGVRKRILEFLVGDSRSIQPYYNRGSVQLVAEKSCDVYDIDISLFLVSREIYRQASNLFYGQHEFVFKDARLATWWFQRIGPANVRKIRTASFYLDDGEVPPSAMRTERLWTALFIWLRSHHKLENILVSFRKWVDRVGLYSNSKHPDSDPDVYIPRNDLLSTLLTYRGLKEAKILYGTYLQRDHVEIYERAMMMKDGETDDIVETLKRELHHPIGKKYSMA